MNNRPEISVIVAVYNVEKYLRRCIDSLLAQTFVDFEIVLIDDGSADGSAEICDEYAAKESRIRVFHQKNAGVASARQKGTDEARGRYSIHVDPDDWVKPTMLEEMYLEALSGNSDIVICDFYEVTANQSRHKGQRPQALAPDVVIKDILSGRLMGSLCNKLVRHDLYERYGIRFATGINYCEDVLICVQLLLNDVRVAYKGNAYYYYDMTGMNSITRNYTASTYDMRKRYIAALQSILPSSYQEYIDYAALQVKVGAFVHGVMTAEEYKAYYPLSIHRILSSIHSPRIKVAFALANMGMFGIGEWFYKAYSRARKRDNRYLLFWGEHELNAGPSNVHRSLITHSQGELHYVKSRHKLSRYIELIWKCIKADVVVTPSFSSSRDIKLIRALCRKIVCISHGCLKLESVINNKEHMKEQIERGERFAFASAKSIVCVSEKHMQVLGAQYPEFADKMTFINNGVEISPRERLKKNPYTIAVSGGNRTIKNNVRVCQAVQQLNNAGLHCAVYIFGRNYPECEDLSKYTCAKYMGQLDKVEYYKSLDEIALFVIASEMESFGLVVADALNCHCSILMSQNVGAAGIMQMREEDFVNDPHDVDELANCIHHLLEHPNAERLLNSVDVQECSESETWKKLRKLCYSV